MAIVAGAPKLAHAEERAGDLSQLRPIRYVSLEFNTVAPVAGRIGGQLVFGVTGRLSIAAGLTHLSLQDGQTYSEYDRDVKGNPSLQGWSVELGPRLYLSKPPALEPDGRRKGRFDWWIGASHIVQILEQGGIMERQSGGYSSYGPTKDVHRQGLAVDIGFQATSAAGFYLLMGVGASGMFAGKNELHSGGSLGILSDSAERKDVSPRFLFAFGFGL